ncbi:Morphogenesis-related protein MSB1 [Colletotrichum aenigma]|uniref:Morphogenesis-related protein MSB1 n=1 Tax=Colletotrichum aenigma TaxID=1215731 RepID=UPI001872C2B2|nr:Morphogenesis-related protein MSB1 [Colletotrichum aenigma]KAF5519610.1 Morphogenesis-related protein MSB1 [Colletotrichum aenigma]
MPSLFSRLKGKDGATKKKKGANFDPADHLPAKPRWDDAYTRKTVEPEEIQDLIRRCTEELKARALDHPFLLLPFRPTSDPSAVRTFIRHFFDGNQPLRGEFLSQELRMTEPMVIAGVVKWCWSRLPGGVVGWDAYELFKVGEQDSNMARDSFKTFIPLSVDNGARSCIIFDFFDLLSAIAAHGKMNGLGGRKLSRMGAWWAFEHKDTGSGFEGGYKSWASAADATSHLFFAYLRSLAPQKPSQGSISMLPMSLQKLLQETEYPPQKPSLMQSSTYKVVMIVDAVSPTPFALLRRANHFQYRDEDRALREFSEYEDPVKALTEECRRVLKAISSANQSQVSSSKHSTSLRDASWSRFEDIGFTSALEDEDDDEEAAAAARKPQGLRTTPAAGNVGLGRPTTPSWADFLSSGFVDDNPNNPNMLLPPDKVLPPIETAVRQRSSQSHNPRLESDRLEPGELASIARFDLDEAFWWVWMSSLAPEETPERKSAFGRCAVIETAIRSGRWLVMEEMVAGAAPEPQEGAYIAEKKGFFSWTRRNKGVNRRKSTGKHALEKGSKKEDPNVSKSSIGPDQQARIQAAAAQLQARQQQEQQLKQQQILAARRGRNDASAMEKTTSVMTLQPDIMKQASPAMKWANKYDKEAIREAYLANNTAGRGIGVSTMQRNGSHGQNEYTNGHANGDELRPEVPEKSPSLQPQPSPLTMNSPGIPRTPSPLPSQHNDEPPAPIERDTETPSGLQPAERFDSGGRSSPMPPPKDSFDLGRENMFTPEPDTSPKDKKQKKLHKEKTGGGGLRKLFGRNKNRNSKLPENAAADVNGMLQRETATPEPPRHAPSPVPQPTATESNLPTPTPIEAYATPMEAPQPAPVETQAHEPQYEPSVDESLSRIDTEDANEAHTEFSRFDQGPLQEQPAFVPDDSDDDDAAPPPIARHKTPEPPAKMSPVSPVSPTDGSRSPQAQDRWAQIRKNAAERAAQRQSEEQSRGGYSKTTDGDDDTSGEETIESRVARIKARVAELTGNMENSTAPGARTPPPIRR